MHTVWIRSCSRAKARHSIEGLPREVRIIQVAHGFPVAAHAPCQPRHAAARGCTAAGYCRHAACVGPPQHNY